MVVELHALLFLRGRIPTAIIVTPVGGRRKTREIQEEQRAIRE